ncbi:hypothetical protein PVAND_007009 [Polypedilum vanderplanki]|uniref:Aspartyl/asparaginy/proline hydroxylase domain-containing protein n=1 Tax=Polypedilum vanderplanki TaxID=319348 RepID=A0A9J6C5D5_POLVA|nr:hypothetical protein PVAND_007009 [Polypedilum vanderplanki]
MSGDVQTRQRRKEKKKPKRDSVDQHSIFKRSSFEEEEISTVPGVDTSKFNEAEKKTVQMHIQESDHGAGICAKIIFFSLMAILLGLVTLIVLENRGGSDVDTPLSESRFSEYLTGWVDENREIDDHHVEPHFDIHDDDPDEETTHVYQKPVVPDDEPFPEERDNSNPDDDHEELNENLNNESENDEDDVISENQNEIDQQDEEQDEDNNENEVNDEPLRQEEEENNENEAADDDENEVPNMFDDSAPFDEEDDDDEDNLNSQEIFEKVIDNDAGEDLLLQKLAEESENAQQQQSQENDGEEKEEESSSLMVKLFVGLLLAIVAHQIIIKKISATNRIDSELNSNEDLLSKRRFTMLSESEEKLVIDENNGDNEEIIEVMMISRPTLVGENEEYSEEEFSEEIEEEEEEYSEDEIIEEFTTQIHTPQTFEDFQNMYRPQPERVEETKRKVTFNEPQPIVEKEVEAEMEEKIFKLPTTSAVKECAIDQKDTKEKLLLSSDEYEQTEHLDMEEELLEDEEIEEEEDPSGEDLLDEEEELDYDDSEEDLSEIDDTELLKRLEAKYGKIDNKQSADDEDDASWTKLPESGDSGAQSYMEEFLKQQALEENPEVKDLYEKAKSLDATAEREKSNKILLEAIEKYKELINVYGDKVNDTIFKEIAEKCIERMRFMGKLKQTVDIHYKLIHRFVENPSYRNQLAVTYLLGNRLSAAKLVLHETLSEWRNNGFALVHYGYVLKNLDQDYENAILYLREGIETNDPGTQDGRFYYNLGDALQRLGRQEEALEVYRKGASIGLFLSEYQRSLYNIDRLKSKPFWTKVETTYKDNLVEIQKYWQIIRDEGLKLLSNDGIFINEQENLKDTGDWKQFELFARGAATKYCHMAPITCKIINGFKAASSCKRGQVKFSVLHPNTHIHSHCGPTNCRIRAHLGLQVPEKTFIRVANETRSWKDGEWLIFDDSFEHEVWHNGTSIRLVLIVDMYHPDLTEDEKRSLSPI